MIFGWSPAEARGAEREGKEQEGFHCEGGSSGKFRKNALSHSRFNQVRVKGTGCLKSFVMALRLGSWSAPVAEEKQQAAQRLQPERQGGEF
jgi:hypothetical protein